MRCRIVVAVAVVAMMLVSPFVFQGSDAQYTYDSPDGTYAYAKHGSGSESNPYWSEILSFSFEGGTVFLQSSLEGYEVTALTSLSGCRADMVVVPRTVTTVADDVLDGASIGTLVFLGDRPDMRVPDGMTILSLGGTSGWEGVSDGTIPLLTYSNGVTSFTYYVLNGEAYVYGAYGSDAILVPDEDPDGHPFTGVDSEAFRDGSVTTVSLGANVSFIGTRAFYGCESLESVDMGGGVKDVRDEAFRDCIGLGDVDLAGVETIGFEAFRDCRSFRSIAIPDSVTSLGGGAFYLCRSATSLDLGGGVEGVPERAFGYCSSLVSVDLTGVTTLGASAFIGCTSLREAVLDSGTVSIGESAFSGCTYLESVDVGNSLRTIGSRAFSECRSLSSLTLPATLVSMGSQVFFHCYSLTDLYFEGAMPEISGDLLFGTTDVSVHIYDANEGSWGSFEGELIVEKGPDAGSDASFGRTIAAVAAAIIILIVTVLAIRLIRVRV